MQHDSPVRYWPPTKRTPILGVQSVEVVVDRSNALSFPASREPQRLSQLLSGQRPPSLPASCPRLSVWSVHHLQPPPASFIPPLRLFRPSQVRNKLEACRTAHTWGQYRARLHPAATTLSECPTSSVAHGAVCTVAQYMGAFSAVRSPEWTRAVFYAPR